MDDATLKITEGLRTAIQAESNGYYFYKMAAEQTKDIKGKETFNILADEEMRHLGFLKAHYESLVKTGKLDQNASLGSQHDFKSSPIFSQDIINRLNTAQFEMSALSIGMQLEASSIAFYRQQAEQVSIPEVSAFFNELVKWEQTHLEILSRQNDMLKEDFWAQGGFAPF